MDAPSRASAARNSSSSTEVNVASILATAAASGFGGGFRGPFLDRTLFAPANHTHGNGLDGSILRCQIATGTDFIDGT